MIPSENCVSQYTGNGAGTSFAYLFPVTDPSEMSVYTTDTSGNVTELILNQDYSVNGVGSTDNTTWTIQYPATGSTDPVLPNGWIITIEPNFEIVQDTDYSAQGNFYPNVVESSFDYLTLICQQLAADIARAVLVPIGSTDSPTPATLLAAVTAAQNAVNAIIAAGGVLIPAGTIGANLTGSLGPVVGQTPITIANLLNIARVTVASAATTPIGAASSNYIDVTGTAAITAFDNVAAGIIRFLVFGNSGATITANAALAVPGNANITTVAGDTAIFVSEGSGNWRCLGYQSILSYPSTSHSIVRLVGSGNWTCPANVTTAKVTIVGAGGGAIATSTSQVSGGGGGASMGVIKYTNLVPGTNYAYVVGAGVAGGTGASTTFTGPGGVITAGGGSAGGAAGTSSAGGNGGSGATGTGVIGYGGGNGGASFYSTAIIMAVGAGGGNAQFAALGLPGVGAPGNGPSSAAAAGTTGVVLIEY